MSTGQGETSMESLPVVQLPESHTIISCLLTFLFPVPSVLPPTIDQTLELLSVAQKYQMTTALTRIRDCISRREPKSVCSENALHVYSLAWKNGLLEEALLAAAETLKAPMTINDLEDKLDTVPGSALAELWEYRRQVRFHIPGSLNTDEVLYALDQLEESGSPSCAELDAATIPRWLAHYLDTVVDDLALFDITTFHLAFSNHISPPGTSSDNCEHCKSIPSEKIRKLWAALTAVFRECIRNISPHPPVTMSTRDKSHHPQAESDFSLTCETQSSTQETAGARPLESLNMQGADVILQSSDLISFRVHKSTLGISSPFFNDLFSLPQPDDGEVVDGLPVVRVPEDAEVLHSLLTLLYPIPSVISDSYEKTLALLAASEKYSMDTVSSTVRGEIGLPTTKAAFGAYAIASSKRLLPEMEAAARLTLDHPMMFEILVDALPLFEGSALLDLVRFRKRCHDKLLSFFVGFVDGHGSLSSPWYGCRKTKRPHSALQSDKGILAGWFHDLLSRHISDLQETYTCPLPKSPSLRKGYNEALRAHISGTQCSFCSNLHATGGEALREKWLRGLTRARNCVRIFPPSWYYDFTSCAGTLPARPCGIRLARNFR
jgi:hypothetical protein